MVIPTKLVAAAGAFVIAGIASISVIAANKLHKLSKKFDKAVDDLSEMTVDDISKALIKEAVKKAADHQVKVQLDEAEKNILDTAKTELRTAVSAAVANARESLSEKTEQQIIEEVAKIDADSLRKEVRRRAEEKVMVKFDHSLDDILGKFNENLQNIGRVYDGIGRMFGRSDSGKGVTFTIGQ